MTNVRHSDWGLAIFTYPGMYLLQQVEPETYMRRVQHVLTTHALGMARLASSILATRSTCRKGKNNPRTTMTPVRAVTGDMACVNKVPKDHDAQIL